MRLCDRVTVKKSNSDPFDAIVQTYLGRNAESEDRYIRFFRIQNTLADAVTKAAMAELPGGGRFSHQWKIPTSALTAARDALLKIDLSQAQSFHELHAIIAKTIGPIGGIGELTIYDTAHRIGAFLGLRPESVYLHAGVRSGAKAIGLDYRAATLPISVFPKPFQKLLPEQVEDCLCIYKEDLKAIKRLSERKRLHT